MLLRSKVKQNLNNFCTKYWFMQILKTYKKQKCFFFYLFIKNEWIYIYFKSQIFLIFCYIQKWEAATKQVFVSKKIKMKRSFHFYFYEKKKIKLNKFLNKPLFVNFYNLLCEHLLTNGGREYIKNNKIKIKYFFKKHKIKKRYTKWNILIKCTYLISIDRTWESEAKRKAAEPQYESHNPVRPSLLTITNNINNNNIPQILLAFLIILER